MVKFVEIGNLEYAKKEPGVPTVDDPVGNYLFKRFQRTPGNKLNVGGRRLTYEEALNYFESGNMLKVEYEELLRKAKPSSFSDKKEEIKASRLLKSDIVKYLFGDIKQLPDAERKKLVVACQSNKSFEQYLRPCLQKRLQEELPEGFEYHKDKLLSALDSSEPLDELRFALDKLGIVLSNAIDYYYKSDLAYSENNDLFQDYCRATQNGGAFALAKVYKKLEGRLGKR